MENIYIMKCLQTLYDLNEDAPDIILFEISLILLVFCNFLEEVTIISVFHYNTAGKMRYVKMIRLLELTIVMMMLRQ